MDIVMILMKLACPGAAASASACAPLSVRFGASTGAEKTAIPLLLTNLGRSRNLNTPGRLAQLASAQR